MSAEAGQSLLLPAAHLGRAKHLGVLGGRLVALDGLDGDLKTMDFRGFLRSGRRFSGLCDLPRIEDFHHLVGGRPSNHTRKP